MTRSDYPLRVVDVFILFLGTVGALSVSECLFRLSYELWGRSTAKPGMLLLYETPILMVPIVGTALSRACIYGQRSVLVMLATMTVTLTTLFYFRGSHRWPGFYDLVEDSRTPFYGGVLSTCLAAFLISRIISPFNSHRYLVVMASLGLVWTWVDYARVLAITTDVPYTRQYALLGLLVLLGIAAVLQRYDLGQEV